MSQPRKTEQHRKPTAVRRTEIVDAAVRIIASRGSRRFTARLLASEIGITEGAIFRHFPSMEAIVEAIIERMESILFEGFPPEGPDPIARLGRFFQQRTKAILANPTISRMLLSDHLAQAGRPTQAARLEEFKRRSQEFVVGCLREAKRSGTLSRDVDPEAAAVILLGSILALSHATTRIARNGKIGRLSEQVWSAIDRALRAPNQPPKRNGKTGAAISSPRKREGVSHG